MIGWLFRLLHRDEPDPAWKPTGYTVKYVGFDQAQLRRAARRAAAAETRRRQLEAKRSRPDAPKRVRRKLNALA